MNKLLSSLAGLAALAFIGFVGTLLMAGTASAQSCTGPCAITTVHCPDGTSIDGPISQLNLLKESCSPQRVYQKPVEYRPHRLIRREHVVKHKPAYLPSSARPVTIVPTGGGSTLPGVSCGRGEKYYRATNPTLQQFGLMVVCDAGYGARNVKGLDNVSWTSRPTSGPLKFKGCVLTDIRDVKKPSAAGCRAGVTSVRVSGKSLIFSTTEGDASYTGGLFGGLKAL